MPRDRRTCHPERVRCNDEEVHEGSRLTRPWLRRKICHPPSRQEVSSMCHDRYLRRRREDEEARAIWQDFERTTPISEPEPGEVEEPERTEAERAEELTT